MNKFFRNVILSKAPFGPRRSETESCGVEESRYQKRFFDSVYPLQYFLLAILLASCASQQPPPGGPIDSTRPALDSVFPAHRETNVPSSTHLWFHFHRDVDQPSFATAFTITPYLSGTPTFHWSGYNEVRVDLPKLRDSTTYTVELARDLKTKLLTGTGMALAEPYFLTFSTGPEIDTGILSGYLLTPINAPPMKPSGLFIFAYDIPVERPDTLNFTHTPPDQITQPNDQGQWQFRAMKVGHRYRVFAIGDVYRNKVYDPGVDAFGIPAGDVTLDSSVTSGMYIRMAPATDTVPPELSDVEIIDSLHLGAHFSEPIDSNDVRASNFKLSSPSSERAGGWGVVSAFREHPDTHPEQIMLLLGTPLVSSHEYTLEGIRDSIYDLSHNALSDSAYKITFTTPASMNAVSPPVFESAGIRDSARDISPLPSLPISLSDAVKHDSLEHAITLTDTGHHLVPVTFRWLDDAHVYLTPSDSLHSSGWYTMTILTAGIQSPVAKVGHGKDSVLHYRFQVANFREFGKISGTITIADSFFAQNTKSALVVQILQGSTIAAQKILPHGETKFEFDQIPTGTYRVRAFLSRDGSGAYDPGSVWPWHFGVPTGEFPKEFDARPRWTIANIDFEVK